MVVTWLALAPLSKRGLGVLCVVGGCLGTGSRWDQLQDHQTTQESFYFVIISHFNGPHFVWEAHKLNKNRNKQSEDTTEKLGMNKVVNKYKEVCVRVEVSGVGMRDEWGGRGRAVCLYEIRSWIDGSRGGLRLYLTSWLAAYLHIILWLTVLTCSNTSPNSRAGWGGGEGRTCFLSYGSPRANQRCSTLLSSSCKPDSCSSVVSAYKRLFFMLSLKCSQNNHEHVVSSRSSVFTGWIIARR